MKYEETFQFDIELNAVEVCGVCYNLAQTGGGFPMHLHSLYELRYNRDGKSIVIVNDRTVMLPAHSLLVIFPLQVHSVLADYEKHLLQVQFSDRFLDPLRYGTDGFYLDSAGQIVELGFVPVTAGSRLEALLDQFCSLGPSVREDMQICADDFTSEIRLRQAALLYQILEVLHQMGNITIEHRAMDKTNNRDYQALFSYIISHLDRTPSLSEAAEFVHRSYYEFSREFSRKFGKSYTELVNHLKIQKAKELLLNGSETITEISEELSFNSSSYFNQVFKKETGVSPSRYKLQMQNAFMR